MLTFPFRLLGTLAVLLFCSSRLMRRAVAGIAISALIVAAQNKELLDPATLKALMGLIPG